jgi:hypothetical protein
MFEKPEVGQLGAIHATRAASLFKKKSHKSSGVAFSGLAEKGMPCQSISGPLIRRAAQAER